MSESPSRVVERMLAERIGLDPSSVGEALIARGVQARMLALGLRTRPEYDRALIDRHDEVQALVEEVVVPESWFFRDERPFEVLAGFARSGWKDDPSRPPLSALSIPCASGEEPYSIAMTLLEAGLPANRFRVDAVDVSARSVARAIAGVYTKNALRGTTSPSRSAFFREQSGAFTVDPSVRSGVRFHLGNLLDPALFVDHPGFDVIFCRNLLIYLDDEAKARAFNTLARLLANGGLLFLGHADRLDDPEGTPFEPTGAKGSFAYRKGPPRVKPATFAGSKGRLAVLPAPVAGAGSRRSQPKASIVIEGKTPPPPSPPQPEVKGPEKKGSDSMAPAESSLAILDRASRLADLGRYDEAIGLVEGSIRVGGGGARAYFLLGLILQASGDRGRAEAHFLKAIYLDPQHDEALLALALLARRKGDIAGESAYRKRAERVLARKAATLS